MSLDKWTYENIATATRRYAKVNDSISFSDADLNLAINQFYMFNFVLDVKPLELEDTYSFSTVSGTDTYAIDDDTIVTIRDYGSVDGYSLKIWFDYKSFYEEWTPSAIVANNRPYEALYYGGNLIMRPTPDDIYSVEIPSWVRPLELVNAIDLPTREEWGNAIALGAAMLITGQFGESDRYTFLSNLYDEAKGKIQGKAISQKSIKRIKPQW